MPDTPETPGVPGDVPALHAEITRLREAGERLRMLLEDKDAVIAHLRARNTELEERVARLERLISRNSGFSELQAISRAGGASPRSARRRRALLR